MKLNDNTLFKTECLIDGTWRRADNGRTLSVRNPATGAHLADVPDMGENETRTAVAAAAAAQKDWAARLAAERSRIKTIWRAS